MKRRITLSIAAAMCAALILMTNSDQAVQAQNQLRTVADSGIIRLGPGQELRIKVAVGDIDAANAVRVRFRQLEYSQTGCSTDGICKQAISSESNSPIIRLDSNEGTSLTFPALAGESREVRAIVSSNRPDTRVNGIVFDTSTQRIVALCCTSQTMYWP